MCFSNLPIEFDDDGDPYLAPEADAVEHADDCDCGVEDAEIATDPEGAYEAIVRSLPAGTRDLLDAASDDQGEERRPTPTADADAAGGD